MTVRHLFSGLLVALSLVFASTSPGLAQTSPPAATSPTSARIELTAPDGRKIAVTVWQAADERAVVVFSHGHGAQPEAYRRIVAQWVEAGFSVVAPLHVDSLAHPDRASFNGPAGFGARVTDLAVVRGYARSAHPGRPLIAAGHSYGSLLSMMSGGAESVAGPLADPDVKAVVAFSSPGDIPGLVTPRTWPALTTPMLMVTGDADLVDGYVTDWRAHRSPFDRSAAGGKMLLIVAGGDHSLVRNADAADFALMAQVTTDFMRTHALGDAAAAARLEAVASSDDVVVERR